MQTKAAFYQRPDKSRRAASAGGRGVCASLIPKHRGRARQQQRLALHTESCSQNDSAPPAARCQPPAPC